MILDRKLWIKQIQDTYQQTKNSAKGKKAQKQEATKTKKSWGSALKNFKETAKSGGVGSAMQKLKQDAHDLKKQVRCYIICVTFVSLVHSNSI